MPRSMNTTPLEQQMRRFMRKAPRGSWMNYYTGFLGNAREHYIEVAPNTVVQANPEAERIGALAMEAYEAGLVLLVQARTANDEYAYLMVKT